MKKYVNQSSPGASIRYGAAAKMRRPSGRAGRAAVRSVAAIVRCRSIRSSAARQVEEQLVHLRLEVRAEELEVLLLCDDIIGREQEAEVVRVERGGLVQGLELFLGAVDRADVVDVILDLGGNLRVVDEVHHQRGGELVRRALRDQQI